MAEYIPTPLSPRFTVLSTNFSLQQSDVHTQLAELRIEVAKLRYEIADLTLQHEVSDLTHAMEADFLYQEITELHRQIVGGPQAPGGSDSDLDDDPPVGVDGVPPI